LHGGDNPYLPGRAPRAPSGSRPRGRTAGPDRNATINAPGRLGISAV